MLIETETVKSGIDFMLVYKTVVMKKDNTLKSEENKAQTGKRPKKGLPVKNAMTDDIKNAATQTPGLNQAKTTRDDLFPSDGDNLTV